MIAERFAYEVRDPLEVAELVELFEADREGFELYAGEVRRYVTADPRLSHLEVPDDPHELAALVEALRVDSYVPAEDRPAFAAAARAMHVDAALRDPRLRPLIVRELAGRRPCLLRRAYAGAPRCRSRSSRSRRTRARSPGRRNSDPERDSDSVEPPERRR